MTASKLEAKRKAKRKKVGEFVQEIGMSRTTYWRKLKGEAEFTRGEIRRIGRVLQMSADELVEIFDLL